MSCGCLYILPITIFLLNIFFTSCAFKFLRTLHFIESKLLFTIIAVPPFDDLVAAWNFKYPSISTLLKKPTSYFSEVSVMANISVLLEVPDKNSCKLSDFVSTPLILVWKILKFFELFWSWYLQLALIGTSLLISFDDNFENFEVSVNISRLGGDSRNFIELVLLLFLNSVISHWVNVTHLDCLLYYKLNTPTCTIRIPHYYIYYKITDSNIAKISKVRMYALQSTCILSNVEFILSFGIIACSCRCPCISFILGNFHKNQTNNYVITYFDAADRRLRQIFFI